MAGTTLKRICATVHDLRDWCVRAATGKRHLPPKRLRDVGPGDFEATGLHFLRLFVGFCALESSARVLEIGCGVGRIALPLTAHLTEGSYVGMDIVKESIRWCQGHVTPRHRNFLFYHANLFNRRYNPNGTERDQNYRFPQSDRSFDFIFLNSVFTHMLPPGVANYLCEIRRLLAPDGKAFCTFFLLNAEQEALARKGLSTIDFKYEKDPYRMRDFDIPESAVAYDERYVLDVLGAAGLSIQPPIQYGTWCGRKNGMTFQDVIVATRKSGEEAP